MAPLIGVALGLAQYVPEILRFFKAGDESVAVAQKVVDIGQAVTGARTPEEALERMRADTAAQIEFRLAVMKNETDLETAYLVDKQNARNRDIEIIKVKGKNFRGDVLAYSAIGALILTIVALFGVGELAESSEKLLYTVLGALIMIVKDVYSFEFGSSKSSERNMQAVTDKLKVDAQP